MRKTFSGLNGIRGVAAIIVAIFHADHLIGTQTLPSGYLAVDLFFVLSGCVISHAYDPILTDGMSGRQFLKMRLLRFYPIYLVGLFFGLMLFAALAITGAESALPSDVLALTLGLSLLFLPTPTTPNLFPLNVPAWSLFFELLVNALYAFLYRYVSDFRLIVVVCLSALVLVVTKISAEDVQDLGKLGYVLTTLVRTTFSFTVGVLIYRYKRLLPSVRPISAIVLLVLVAAVNPTSDIRTYYDLICVLLVFPIIIGTVLGSEPDGSDHRIYNWLGEMSYPLYAVHYPIIWLANGFANRLGLSKPLIAVLLIPSLIFFAHLLEKKIDLPLRKWIRARR